MRSRHLSSALALVFLLGCTSSPEPRPSRDHDPTPAKPAKPPEETAPPRGEAIVIRGHKEAASPPASESDATREAQIAELKARIEAEKNRPEHHEAHAPPHTPPRAPPRGQPRPGSTPGARPTPPARPSTPAAAERPSAPEPRKVTATELDKEALAVEFGTDSRTEDRIAKEATEAANTEVRRLPKEERPSDGVLKGRVEDWKPLIRCELVAKARLAFAAKLLAEAGADGGEFWQAAADAVYWARYREAHKDDRAASALDGVAWGQWEISTVYDEAGAPHEVRTWVPARYGTTVWRDADAELQAEMTRLKGRGSR